MSLKHKVNQYLDTVSGRVLLRQHSLEDVDTWAIEVEKPNENGDFYIVATVTGTLLDAVISAVEMPIFWYTGAGGIITKYNDTDKLQIRKSELINRINELREELVDAEIELANLGN